MCEVNLVVDEAGEVATMSTELGIKELIALVPRNRVDKLCRRRKKTLKWKTKSRTSATHKRAV